MLEVLGVLIGLEAANRQQRPCTRLAQARLPKRKALEEYDFTFPKRVARTAIVRLFDCDFIERHGCAVFIGPTGTGKSHLVTALGYAAAERGYSVRMRVVDLINHLTTAQINGLLGRASKVTSVPVCSSSMSWAICRSTSAGLTCCSRWSRPVMKPDRSC